MTDFADLGFEREDLQQALSAARVLEDTESLLTNAPDRPTFQPILAKVRSAIGVNARDLPILLALLLAEREAAARLTNVDPAALQQYARGLLAEQVIT